ncbi:GTP diphosphokinase [Paraferrimonas sedimenticola]|uniref:GTP pyrophosphokinase n=1 Tax=Paraferrimonas sedimenticola TaxID=375674 RepID=A0AA37RX35_9GAMM|nr:GTP diphosphokinase [Paraferrimonas sedimenticola]GLP96873.1 GTP pyrophosphokinase [Paraferrimonas sedimenticola]
MVAVRESHFAGPDFDLNAWVERYCPELEQAPSLLRVIEAVMSLAQSHCNDEEHLHLCSARCRELIEILSPLNMDLETLQAAVLFVANEEGWIELEQIEEDFGKNLATLVQSVQAMDAIRTLNLSQSANPGQIDNLRRMLLAMVEDVRAVVIKLAERVVLLREAKTLPETERVLLAREIAEVFAPLANRLGIGQLKWELEDLAFRYQHPDTYKDIARLLDQKRIDREQYIEAFVAKVQHRLDEEHVKGKVYGRPKHIYSIWKKMQNKQLQFDKLFDVRAVRIVTERLQDCYAALGVVHSLFKHIPQEFDDYVANPKPNGYQSIHTVVLGPEGRTVEIQIRTDDMHQDAELGVAAHWKYKEGGSGGKPSGYEEKINWLRKILQWQEDVAESGNLVDEIRSQVFEDRVYVFTPGGEVVDLPLGSTVLDFAYYIHSQVGHKAIGAKVDGRIVPFTYQVATGERVEIITSKQPNPKRDWLNPNLGYIYSSRARSKISHFFKLEDKDKNQAAGKEILENELGKIGLNISDAETAIERFNVHSLEDLMAAVGAGDVRINQVINHIQSRQRSSEDKQDEDLEKLLKKTAPSSKPTKGQIEVEGVGNLMTHIAGCCHPLPGDPIQGFITQGRGISVHRSDCPQLKELLSKSPERAVDVVWGENYSGGYRVKLKVIGSERPGLLRDVTTLLANEKINVVSMATSSDAKRQLHTVDLELEFNNIDGLSRVMHKMEQIPGIIESKRQ